MAKRKQKTGMEEATAIVMGFANLVDALFQRYTGKTMQTLLTESARRPRELPAGEKTAPAEADMPLADALRHTRSEAWSPTRGREEALP